jgi:2-phospho-L-lactate guanylyltransferase
METVVPLAVERPKTRLEGVLSADERSAFARAMCRDVLAAARGAGLDPTVLATTPIEGLDAPVTVDDRPLSPAVNAVLEGGDGPVCVLVADLALVTPAAVSRLLEATGDVVVAPGRGGGTNALVVRHPEFRVDYHGCSFCDHREAIRALGGDLEVVDSMRLATDVDEPEDLVEVLVHGEGEAADWLRERGFRLATGAGRVGAVRDPASGPGSGTGAGDE